MATLFKASTMKPEAQRIAIAEVCGWIYITPSLLCGYAPWRKQYEPKDIPTDGSLPIDNLPDYLYDLNAMHEAEKFLPCGRWTRYCQYLAELGRGSVRFVSVHATADQRAEAFLKTLNLWKE